MKKTKRSEPGWGRIMRFPLSLSFVVAVLVSACLAQQTSSSPAGVGQAAVGSASATAPAKPSTDSAPDPLLDVPPLPKTRVTLVGGVVTGIDRVRNKLSVEAFGGKKMKFVFDERTHIYLNGVETTQLGIKKGDRVYVDTQLDGANVFARNIRVENKSGPADAAGQVVSYDAGKGTLVVRDQLSTAPVSFRLTKETSFEKNSSAADLVPGTLVKLTFAPGKGDPAAVERVQIEAKSGEIFTFAGQVTYLDVSRGVLALRNQVDNKTYDIRFDPASPQAAVLRLGSEATITAAFEDSGYVSRSISVHQAQAQQH